MKFLVINGPNLNLLGIREPHIYGKTTYDALLAAIRERASQRGISIEFFQSNHEGAIVDEIQRAYFEKFDAIVLNPAAYTHTSVAIADAIKAVRIPTAEVHISDVDTREDFRKINYVRSACCFSSCGKGVESYLEAIDFLADYLANDDLRGEKK